MTKENTLKPHCVTYKEGKDLIHQNYYCMAEDVVHAKEQCYDGMPGCTVTGAFQVDPDDYPYPIH